MQLKFVQGKMKRVKKSSNTYSVKDESFMEEKQKKKETTNVITTIHSLNEHCLSNIFKYLPIKDRIRMERGNYKTN